MDSRKFQYIQDLATIDVLRDIEYPSCAYLVRLLRIYICAHAYLNNDIAREYIYIRRGLRVVGSNVQGNARASRSGTDKSAVPLLFLYPILRINYNNINLKNKKIMKKSIMAIVLCLMCTLSFGQSIVCQSDSTPIILPGCSYENQEITVFDLVPDATNTIEVFKDGNLYESFNTTSCQFKFKLETAGTYDVTVSTPYLIHNQKIIILQPIVSSPNDSITMSNDTIK